MAEKNRGLGYNGQSGRTKRWQNKDARDKEIPDERIRNSYVVIVKCIWKLLTVEITAIPQLHSRSSSESHLLAPPTPQPQ